MTRLRATLAPLAVLAVGLAVRIPAAAGVTFPIPEGSAYYVAAAANLATGRGLVVDVVWSYATPPLVVPRAAFDLWQPLASLIAAPFMAIGLEPLAGAQVPSVLLGALCAVLSWAVARRSAGQLGVPPGRAAAVGLTAGLLVALTPLLVVQAAEPDSSVPFTALALAAAWSMPAALSERAPGARRRVLLGLLLGAAYLARQEAVWLGFAYLALAWRSPGDAARRVSASLARIAPTVLAAAVVIVPWLIRQSLTWEASPFAQVLENAWLTSGSDIFAWSARPTAASYLAVGPAGLLGLRGEALVGSVGLVLVAAFPGGPLGLLAWAVWPRWLAVPSLRPLGIAAAAMLAVDVVVFPVASLNGLWAHGSGPAIALLAILAALGLDQAVTALAVIRGWRPSGGPLGRLALLGPLTAAMAGLPLTALATTLEHERAVVAEAQYGALAATAPLWDVASGPLVTDHPMWLGRVLDRPALALPREAPAAVVGLIRHFSAAGVVVRDPEAAALATALAEYTENGRLCFHELAAPAPFRALAFICPSELAASAWPRAVGRPETRPYTGSRAWNP